MRAAAILVTMGLVAALSATPTPAAAKPGRKAAAPRALVIVIDRSGSMQGPKLEAVKAAARSAVEALKSSDEMSIVTFDSEAVAFLPRQRVGNRKAIVKQIATLTSGGGTNVAPGLQVALDELRGTKARAKHVILLSDGESPSEGIADIVTAMVAEHITVSTIGVAGADTELLESISTPGGGRMYTVGDLSKLPAIYVDDIRVALR